MQARPFHQIRSATTHEPGCFMWRFQVRVTCEHLHTNHIADRDLAGEQFLDSVTGRGPGAAKKFDPRGRIDQNHAERLVRNSLRSPSQPDPRRRRASSTLKGSAARARRAKLIASRFVFSR